MSLFDLEREESVKEPLAYRMRPQTLDEYAGLVTECVKILPEETVLHRMTGDGPRKLLIAPLWCLDKKRVLNEINRAFERDRIRQGKRN